MTFHKSVSDVITLLETHRGDDDFSLCDDASSGQRVKKFFVVDLQKSRSTSYPRRILDLNRIQIIHNSGCKQLRENQKPEYFIDKLIEKNAF